MTFSVGIMNNQAKERETESCPDFTCAVIAAYKKHVATNLPIIYTVDSVDRGDYIFVDEDGMPNPEFYQAANS